MKSIFKSKTVIIAILQGVLGVAIAMQSVAPELGQLMFLKSIVDIALRYVTTESVTIL